MRLALSLILLYHSTMVYSDSYAPWFSDAADNYLFDDTTRCIAEGVDTYLCLFPDILAFVGQSNPPCIKCSQMTTLRLYPGFNLSCLTIHQLIDLNTLFPQLQYVTFNNSWHRCCGTIELNLICPNLMPIDHHSPTVGK